MQQITKGKKNLTEEDRKQAKLESIKSAAYVFKKTIYFKKITEKDSLTTTHSALLTAQKQYQEEG